MSQEVPSDPAALLAYLSENEIGDGLPVVPPTEDRVRETLARTSRSPSDVLLQIPTSGADLSVQALARCAVMAGCRPAYFPGVVAAFEGMATWENLRAPIATTSGFAILSIINGPVRDAWNVNSKAGVFGPGYRANATIGRAVNLAFMIVGGTFPETGTMATQAHPGRYTYCIGENEAHSSWSPLHVDLCGFAPDESTVTVLPAQGPKLIGEGDNTAPEDVLDALADGAIGAAASEIPIGPQTVFVLSQDHAGRLGAVYEKHEVKSVLYEQCTRNGELAIESPEDVLLVVAGGNGNYSSVLHTWRAKTPAVCTPIEEA